MMEGLLTVGQKFAAWGVELDRAAEEGNGGIFIPTEGDSAPDTATAQEFIKGQVGP